MFQRVATTVAEARTPVHNDVVDTTEMGDIVTMPDGTDGRAATAAGTAVPVTGRKPRAPRLVRKEAPIAFRPRPGTRARLERRAGDRALSRLVEDAVDADLGRKVVEVDPELRQYLSAELGTIADRLAGIEHQTAGIGRNANQIAKFLHGYRELPANLGANVLALNGLRQEVLEEIVSIRETVATLVGATRP